VRAPRFCIAWLMVAVAIAAIDFAAIRALLGLGASLVRGLLLVGALASLVWGLLLVGALPMANMLIVGILIARQRVKSRPFLLGFEVFGVIALALYIYLATSSPLSPLSARGPIESYLLLVFDPLNAVIGSYHPFVRSAIQLFVGVLMLIGPQLVFALAGGFLSRRFKFTISPRP
jgi:hypothetical protein